jgi:hypothetical protein
MCFKCGRVAKYSVLLAVGPGRWYVPNQFARSSLGPPLVEVRLCEDCARFLDDLINAYLPPPPDQPHGPANPQNRHSFELN